jgi:hypothetical protein
MNIYRFVVKLGTLFMVLNLALGDFAFACYCESIGTAEIELANSDFVFIGKVIQVTERNYVSSTKLQVIKKYKGGLGEVAIVHGLGSDCDWPFQKDKEYLVFAFGSSSTELSVFECSGTSELTAPFTQRNLEALDKLCYNTTQAISDYSKAMENNPKAAWLYEYRAIAYFVIRDYNKSWLDVARAKELGVKLEPRFLENLKKASGREK